MNDKTKAGHTSQECCGGSSCATKIHEHMDVFGSCGNKLGQVDRVEGDSIKLTKASTDGQHHFIPLAWVAKVDQGVRLTKNCGEAQQDWGNAPIGAGVG